MISTEALLTDPAAFGIATASPAQRAICRILDGRPLGELRTHPETEQLVGGVDALASLPNERRVQPREVVVLAAIRCAKTILACCAALRMTQTVDLSGLGPGEVARVSFISLKLDITSVAYRLLLETLRASPFLSALLVDDTADVITVRHPSGRSVEIACVAGAKAGGGLVARWSAGVVFDEAPRMDGASDAIVNLDHARTAVIGRLLPGAQALYIGSPWAPRGPIYDLVQVHWGKPSENMVVVRGTGPMLNPRWWTFERCSKLQEQDPVAYQTDVLGDFADPESGLLNPAAVRRNERDAPLELAPESGGAYVAAVDPSEGSASGNAQTIVIIQSVSERVRSDDGESPNIKYRVAVAREWRGLRPEQFWEQVTALCVRYGLTHAWTDQYAASSNADLARRYGLTLRIDKTTAQSKLERFTDLGVLIHSDRVELPPLTQFRRDLLSIRKRITQAGVTIVLPKTGDGRHADYCPALVLALAHPASTSHADDMKVISVPGRYSDYLGAEVLRRDLRRLSYTRAGSIARLRALLGLAHRTPLPEVALAVERCTDAGVDEAALDTLLVAITGVSDRKTAARILHSDTSPYAVHAEAE